MLRHGTFEAVVYLRQPRRTSSVHSTTKTLFLLDSAVDALIARTPVPLGLCTIVANGEMAVMCAILAFALPHVDERADFARGFTGSVSILLAIPSDDVDQRICWICTLRKCKAQAFKVVLHFQCSTAVHSVSLSEQKQLIESSKDLLAWLVDDGDSRDA